MKLVLKMDEKSLKRAEELLDQALKAEPESLQRFKKPFHIVVVRNATTGADERTLWLGLKPTKGFREFLTAIGALPQRD